MAHERIYPKLDEGLAAAFSAWQEGEAEEIGHAHDGISVTLRFEGDLAAIEAAGFETDLVMGNDALGVVRFKDVEAIAALPGVVRMSVGRAREPTLDTAVDEIDARATSAIGGGTLVDGPWHIGPSGGTLTSIADGTGKDVIVAVIDSGIDYKHPMFMKSLTSPKKTRILRIWDHGLEPASSAEWPDVNLLVSTKPYGVEYDTSDIEADLNGGTALRHKDCNGHGTHVAGIAAGGVLFASGGDSKRVGVAPEASIVVVKILDVPGKIFFRRPDNSRDAVVEWERRFRDAIIYCLRLAKKEGKPVIINISLGNVGEPGDALDEDALFVDRVMDPNHAADDMHFPKGAVIVKSAGNNGNGTHRRGGKITMPPGQSEIIVPFILQDERDETNHEWRECGKHVYSPRIGIYFWYRRDGGSSAVQFALRSPHGTFGSDVSVPATAGTIKHVIGFHHAVRGGTPTDEGTAASSSVFRLGIDHEDPGLVMHPSGNVHRHRAYCYVEPKVRGSSVTYHPGRYEVRIKAPAGTELFVMCDRKFWVGGKFVMFHFPDSVPTGVEPGVKWSTVDPLGEHVITVAGYDDANGRLYTSSSRGPLRDFRNPTQAARFRKPDIAAPGVRIDSAAGRDTQALTTRDAAWHRGVRFTPKTGTSMATPMVAGVIALMLDKNGVLSTTDVRGHLATRAGVGPASGQPAGALVEMYGAGRVDATNSHRNTP